jgi:hypothetical protein
MPNPQYHPGEASAGKGGGGRESAAAAAGGKPISSVPRARMALSAALLLCWPPSRLLTCCHPLPSAGAFELAIADGIAAYRAPRPQLVVLSSAGVERNAIVGDDAGAAATRAGTLGARISSHCRASEVGRSSDDCSEHAAGPALQPRNPSTPPPSDTSTPPPEARKKEIPIVQLNPGGVLNWKVRGHAASLFARLRASPPTAARCQQLRVGLAFKLSSPCLTFPPLPSHPTPTPATVRFRGDRPLQRLPILGGPRHG